MTARERNPGEEAAAWLEARSIAEQIVAAMRGLIDGERSVYDAALSASSHLLRLGTIGEEQVQARANGFTVVAERFRSMAALLDLLADGALRLDDVAVGELALWPSAISSDLARALLETGNL